MTTYGVTPQGFVPKPQPAILADIEAALQATFGAAINLEPESNFAQLAGIMSEQIAELWEAAEDVYNSAYPDGATGTSLDNVAAITGTVRSPATEGTVTALLVGTLGAVVPAGTVLQVQAGGGNFVTLVDSPAMASVAGWPRNTAVTLGEFFSQDGNLYLCVGAGTTANVAHAAGYWTTLTGTAIVDGGATWRFLAQGAATAAVACQAQSTGPIPAPAYTLTVIQTPVFGLTASTNLLDAVPGTSEEVDGDLRVKREEELRADGNGSADAIRAKVLEIPGIINCTVFENDTDAIDGDGVPPHSVNVLVRGNGAQAIANAIWAAKPAGIATYGAQSATVTDKAGVNHTVYWDVPTPVDVWIAVNLTTNAAYPSLPQFPSSGAADVQAALVEWALGTLVDDTGLPVFRGYQVGDPVVTSKLYLPVESVPGIFDVNNIFIAESASPATSFNLILTSRQLAVFDTSRITVNVF